MISLATDKDKLMILKNQLNELVRRWTEKAQTDNLTEEQRIIYYECAEQLHSLS